MDPVTAFMLFCSVLDLVDKSITYGKLVKKLYDVGLTDDHENLENGIKTMETVVAELGQAQTKAGHPKSGLDLQIANVISRCVTFCTSLQALLDKCKPKRAGSWRSASAAAIRLLLKESEIQTVQKGLEDCRAQLSVLFSASA